MALLSDDLFSPEQCLQLVQSNLAGWNDRLDSISASILEWHEQYGHPEDPDSGVANLDSRKRSNSLQSLEERRSRKKDSEDSDSDDRPDRQASPVRITQAEQNRNVHFDLQTQKLFEDLVRSLQVARNQLLRCITAATPATSANERKRKFEDSPTSAGAAARTDSAVNTPAREKPRPLLDSVKRLEELIKGCQDECETAAHKLLRQGSCSTQLLRVRRLLQRCSDAVKPPGPVRSTRSDAVSVRSGVSPSRPATQNTASTNPAELEVDDDDEEETESEEDEDAKFNAIRATGKQFASRIGSGKQAS